LEQLYRTAPGAYEQGAALGIAQAVGVVPRQLARRLLVGTRGGAVELLELRHRRRRGHAPAAGRAGRPRLAQQAGVVEQGHERPGHGARAVGLDAREGAVALVAEDLEVVPEAAQVVGAGHAPGGVDLLEEEGGADAADDE